MEPILNHMKIKNPNEPADKYGVHFDYQDLYQRLLIIKKQRERQYNNIIFKSFDRETRKSPTSISKSRHKSKSSVRSNSVVKHYKFVPTDIARVSRIYSPSVKKKNSSPSRFLGSIKFHQNIIPGTTAFKKRITRARVYNN
jgi:hypothetical protein